ncbi:MAG: hypothetical protein M1831_000327 [Alyxoria varia]|nr:MAG: hypothetical protein M1831_000327 [Alyxoria varia]
MRTKREKESRPPVLHAALAGGLGGVSGDMLLHSLDTVKTRQQGDPYRPPKYSSIGNTFFTLWRQEGLVRGLYGGVLPAFLGSFIGTSVFFGGYEFSKGKMMDYGLAPSISYCGGGLFADLVASPLYVPTEVLKTRLQLQGRYNNPYFKSGYNYRSSLDAARTIARMEGLPALFYGYRATLYRDLPFSALQFAFYEEERKAVKWWVGSSDIGLPMEVLVGATAGGAAGTFTCPLDVVKTRIQTQVNPTKSSPTSSTSTPITTDQKLASADPKAKGTSHLSRTKLSHGRSSGSATLDTSSVAKGLSIIYRTEGLAGWFRGVGPRAVWTSIQSGTMFVLYQVFLREFERYQTGLDD